MWAKHDDRTGKLFAPAFRTKSGSEVYEGTATMDRMEQEQDAGITTSPPRRLSGDNEMKSSHQHY